MMKTLTRDKDMKKLTQDEEMKKLTQARDGSRRDEADAHAELSTSSRKTKLRSWFAKYSFKWLSDASHAGKEISALALVETNLLTKAYHFAHAVKI